MKIQLEILHEKRVVRVCDLGDGEHTLGSVSADVLLQYPTVSRRHGCIIIGDGEVHFRDLGSRNGSRLNRNGTQTLAIAYQDMHWPEKVCLHVGPFILNWRLANANEQDKRDAKELSQHSLRYSKALHENPTSAWDVLCDGLKGLPESDQAHIAEQIRADFHGNGPITPYIDNPKCREILINRFDEIYVDLGLGLERLQTGFSSEQSFDGWVLRLVTQSGRRLDQQHPICEATLPNGARFHAVVPPVSSRGLSVAIRRFGSAPLSEQTALNSRWLSSSALSILKRAVAERKNIVISGGTSTGKTSLLNFLCRYLEPTERVITVEDTIELSPPTANLVQLQGRNANSDGVGQVSLRQLVQCALRMRPDRIIVGECRGDEVIEMLQALNTGHPGSMTTVHANSAEEALQRLELLALLGATNLSVDCIRQWITASVDVVVQLERDIDGKRQVVEILEKKKGMGHHERIYDLHPNQMVQVNAC